MSNAGIKVLKNEAITVNQLVILGRNDDLDLKRPDTKDLLEGVNLKYPVILLDHRPSQIKENAQLPIDIQVSGHTHNGQIFPANFLVKLFFDFTYGYTKINNVNFFVTSGYGFWGIPFRLGSQSEIVIIDVKGK